MTSVAMRRRLRVQAGIRVKRTQIAASPFRGPTRKATTAADTARAQLRHVMKRRIGWECLVFEGRHDGQGGEYVALLREDGGNSLLLVASCAGNLMIAGRKVTVFDAIHRLQNAVV